MKRCASPDPQPSGSINSVTTSQNRHNRFSALIATAALITSCVTAIPVAHAQDVTLNPYAPVSSIEVTPAVSKIAVSKDGSALYAFSATEKALTSYALDDCTKHGVGIETLKCAVNWSVSLPQTPRDWHVDESGPDAGQIFVLSQNDSDAAVRSYATDTGAAIGNAVTIPEHTVHGLTYAPVNNHVYVLADDGVVLVDLDEGSVASTIVQLGDGVDGELPVLKQGQQAITYNSFSTGSNARPTPDGIVYAAYGEYLTTVNVSTNTRVDTTRRLTSPAGISQTGITDSEAAAPSLFTAGTLSTGTYRTFGISSQSVHGKEQNAIYLYNTLAGGSTSTNGAAWVSANPVGIALSTTEDLVFAASESDNSVAIVDATATGNNAPTELEQKILLGESGVVSPNTADVAGLAIHESEDGVSVFVANPTSGTVTVLERRAKLESAAPTITGTAQVAKTLTALPGSWTEGTSFHYQWLVNGNAVPGATAATYQIEPADVDKTITVSVTGVKDGFAATTVTSAATPTVIAGELVGQKPTISGSPAVDRHLTATVGNWSNGTVLSYQWFVAGQPIPGAINAVLTPRAQDLGKTVTVAVTAAKPGYLPLTLVSDPTSAVAHGTLVPATPKITGKIRVGNTLTAAIQLRSPGANVSYQWRANGKPLHGATGPRLTLGAQHRGQRITVVTTTSKPGYLQAFTQSSATAPVRAGKLKAAKPKLKGKVRVGKRLTVKTGRWTSGTKLSYRWYANGKKIAKANKPRLSLKKKYVGKKITVKVTGKKRGYLSVTKSSKNTRKVTKRVSR